MTNLNPEVKLTSWPPFDTIVIQLQSYPTPSYRVFSFPVFERAASENTLLHRNYLHIFVTTLPTTEIHNRDHFSALSKIGVILLHAPSVLKVDLLTSQYKA
jgi:hypothetical protein